MKLKKENSIATYKNIEKEFGISLDIFYKAIKNGIWSKEHLSFANKASR